MKKIFSKKNRSKKELFIILSFLFIAMIASVIMLATSADNKAVEKIISVSPPEVLTTSVIGHTRGGGGITSVELVEYSDLQCPACGVYYPVVKSIVEEFGSELKFTYRHFPLKQIHQNAFRAALATEAAGLQGKFWEMHDILFERQNEWSNKSGDDIFSLYAREVGLDAIRFESDLAFNEEIKNKVDSDYQSGITLGVNSTPSFFLNGAKMQNPRSYEEFRDIIQQFIIAQ